jgi:uncharacterized membrane-anchored protein
MTTKETRETQIIDLTEEEREEGREDNPILYAESAPNRYQSITYWFPEGDGVEVQQNQEDEEDITVRYLGKEEETTLTEGALYEWALDLFLKD